MNDMYLLGSIALTAVLGTILTMLVRFLVFKKSKEMSGKKRWIVSLVSPLPVVVFVCTWGIPICYLGAAVGYGLSALFAVWLIKKSYEDKTYDIKRLM